MKHTIDHISKEEYPEVVEVWEASVRATHDFLAEADIQYFKPLILNTYLDAVELRCVRNEAGKIVAFSGVADQNLEMLFIHPDFRGFGMGKTLLNCTIEELNVQQVDVNEQNDQAVGFYLHNGFEVYGRSELDPTGKPYPIFAYEINFVMWKAIKIPLIVGGIFLVASPVLHILLGYAGGFLVYLSEQLTGVLLTWQLMLVFVILSLMAFFWAKTNLWISITSFLSTTFICNTVLFSSKEFRWVGWFYPDRYIIGSLISIIILGGLALWKRKRELTI